MVYPSLPTPISTQESPHSNPPSLLPPPPSALALSLLQLHRSLRRSEGAGDPHLGESVSGVSHSTGCHMHARDPGLCHLRDKTSYETGWMGDWVTHVCMGWEGGSGTVGGGQVKSSEQDKRFGRYPRRRGRRYWTSLWRVSGCLSRTVGIGGGDWGREAGSGNKVEWSTLCNRMHLPPGTQQRLAFR